MLGVDYWNGEAEHKYSYPVWLLLEQSASEDYRSLLAITDDETEVFELIMRYEPEAHRV